MECLGSHQDTCAEHGEPKQPEKNRLAEMGLRRVLELQPDHEQARFYLAQLKQWQPFNWPEAKKDYERILRENPYHGESKENLALIRKEYNPLFISKAEHLNDSNGLKKTEASILHSRYLAANWELRAESIYRRLEEKKSAGEIISHGEGLRLGGTWHISPKFRVLGNGGFVHFNQGDSFGLLEIKLQQSVFEQTSWPGQLYLGSFLKLDNVMDGVPAVKQKFTARRLGQSLFWNISPALLVSGQFEHSWYSDDNRKVDIYAEGQFRFLSGPPSFYLTAVYSYLDMRLFYPESEPYWTPQEFWTRSIGLTSKFLLGSKAWLVAGNALTEQTGNKPAHNWKAEVSWQPNEFTLLNVSFRDYGSNFYSYRNWAAQFSYRM